MSGGQGDLGFQVSEVLAGNSRLKGVFWFSALSPERILALFPRGESDNVKI